MDMAREAGLDAKNFLGRGTNVLKFPKQDEITPYKPNFLQSMKEFGQDSVTAVKNKLQDEMNFLTTSTDMDLQNYKNNLQDYLDFIVKPKQKREGIMGAKSAELVDIKTGKPFDPNVKTSIEERMGVPENVDPESPMGGMMGTANKIKELIEDIESITPQQRAAMDAKAQKEVIEEYVDAGGREQDINMLLKSSVGDISFFKRNTLPKAKTVAEMNPKNEIQLQLGIDAEDTAETFGEDGIGKVIGHFEKYYQPNQVRYTMETAIEDEIVKLGKGNRDDVSEALLDVKRNAKQEDYFAELKEVAKKFDYDLDTTFYKNYEDTYTFRNDPKYFERLMKNVKVEDIDPEPFRFGVFVKRIKDAPRSEASPRKRYSGPPAIAPVSPQPEPVSVSIKQTPKETIEKFNLNVQEPSTSPTATSEDFLAKLDQTVSGPDEQKQRMFFDYLNNYLGISNLFTRRS